MSGERKMETVLLLRGVVLAVAELASVAVAATHDEMSSVESFTSFNVTRVQQS